MPQPERERQIQIRRPATRLDSPAAVEPPIADTTARGHFAATAGLLTMG
jgi:hypothetical protein